MEKTKETIALYHQEGHRDYPEDTWSRKQIINNKSDLVYFFKEIYKDNARSFSNYPEGGFVDYFNLSFEEFFTVKIDEVLFSSKPKKTTAPEFKELAILEIEKLIKRCNLTIPNAHKIREKKQKKEKDLKELKRLQGKYNT